MASEDARIHGTSHAKDARNADIVDETSPSILHLPVRPFKSGEQSGYLPRMRDFTPPYPRADAYRATLGSWYGSSLDTRVGLSRCSTECPNNGGDCCIAGLAEQMACSMLNHDHEETDKSKNSCDEIFESEAGSTGKISSSPAPSKIENMDQTEYNWSKRVLDSRSSMLSDCSPSPGLLSPSLNQYYSKQDCWYPTFLQGNEISSSMTKDASTALKHHELIKPGCRGWEDTPTHVRSKFFPRIPSSQIQSSFEFLDSSTRASSISSNSVSFKSNQTECLNGPSSRRQTEDFKYSNIKFLKQEHSSSWNRSNKNQQNLENMRLCQRKSVLGRSSSSSSVSDCRSVHFNGGGSGMRAVFLGGTGAGRESIGTGVFLPRCRGVGNESKRKPSCSSVLLPSRIVQVLNLQVEDIRSLPFVPSGVTRIASLPLKVSSPSRGLGVSGDIKYPSSKVRAPEQFTFSSQAYQRSIESMLPSEWTY